MFRAWTCVRAVWAAALLGACAGSDGALPAAPDAAWPAADAESRSADVGGDPPVRPPEVDAPSAEAAAGADGADAAAASFQPCPPAGAPCRILPLGDSLTFGVGSAGPGGGYRVPLYHRVLAAKQAVTFVGSQANGPATVDGVVFPRGHEGYRGYAIEAGGGRDGLARIVEEIVSAARPQVVLLLAGTNDVGATIIDPAHAPDRLGALIDRIVQAAPEALIVAAQIPPSMNDATNARIQAFNGALPAVIEARVRAGRHVQLVDAYQALAGQASYRTTLMFNEFHPNDAGYARIADRWYEALQPFLR
jgi:lysophospholipase L1-like esterase